MTDNSIKPQFVIKKAIITADGFSGSNGIPIENDVTAMVAELSIFESLDVPYLTGNAVIMDTTGLFSDFRFQGTERIEFEIGTGDNENTTAILKKRFIMTGIQKKSKTNENANSSSIAFNMIDEHGFLGRVNKISKSYNGSLETMVKRILQNELGRKVDISYTGALTEFDERSAQQDIKCIVPNLTPIDAVRWLTSRITTQTGSPYFVYSTLVMPDLSGNGDNNTNTEDNEQGCVVRLGNLDTMLQQLPFNKIPYRFTPQTTTMELDPTTASYTIKAINISASSSTLELMEKGAVMSQYTNTDLGTGEVFTTKYTLNKQLQNLRDASVIEKDDTFAQDILDPNFTLNNLNYQEYNAKKYHTITSMGTYGNTKGYHDETDENKFNLKVASRSLFFALKKNPISVVVEGMTLLIARAKVGDIIDLDIIGDNVNAGEKVGQVLDSRYSGNYLIYDMKHQFTSESHNCVLQLYKIESEEVIE